MFDERVGEFVVVGELEELALLAFDPELLAVESVALDGRTRSVGRDDALERCPDFGQHLVDPFLDGDVVGFDCCFGDPGRDVALFAAILFLAAEAVEVLVFAAVAPAVREANPFVAVAAAKRAFEVVAVAPGLVAPGVVGIEDGLDFVVGFGVDERFVFAGVLRSTPGDDADVVRVAQQPVEGALGDRTFGVAAGLSHRESAVCEFFAELVHGVMATSERLERPDDVFGPVGVWFDSCDVADAVDGLSDVEVAGWAHAGRAASPGLFGHLGRDFFGQFGGVHLCESEVQGLHELAGGGVVPGLGHRDEVGAVVAQLFSDSEAFGCVACEPVDLVHDEPGDVVVSGSGDRGVELRSAHGGGSVAGLDVDLGEGGAEVSSFQS
ncbi:MAG: hypothetical protein AAF081_08700 [Actinomycetota bacterium]